MHLLANFFSRPISKLAAPTIVKKSAKIASYAKPQLMVVTRALKSDIETRMDLELSIAFVSWLTLATPCNQSGIEPMGNTSCVANPYVELDRSSQRRALAERPNDEHYG